MWFTLLLLLPSLFHSLEITILPSSSFCLSYTSSFSSSLLFSSFVYATPTKGLHYTLERVYPKIEKISDVYTNDFVHSLNVTKKEEFNFCVHNDNTNGGVSREVFFNVEEKKRTLIDKLGMEGLNDGLEKVIWKLKKINENVFVKRRNSKEYVAITENNMKEIKWCSFIKLAVVAVITIAEIAILVKFLERKEKKMYYGKI